MEWILIDKDNLPEGEVLAANFKKGTYGYSEKLIGYLYEDMICSSDDEQLENCTHYIEINKHDVEAVD